MCFSAEASFATAAVLIPAGGYCVRAARVKAPTYTALAFTPLFFAVQQAAEGFVWLGLGRQEQTWVDRGAPIYLVFALGFWPVWFTIVAVQIEHNVRRLRWLALWCLVAAGWFWWWAWPLLVQPELAVSVHVVGRSLRYEYADQFIGLGLRVAYWATGAVPMLMLTDWRRFVIPVAIGIGSALISHWFFGHAFTSVWCFFAALFSAYLVYLFHRLPQPVTR